MISIPTASILYILIIINFYLVLLYSFSYKHTISNLCLHSFKFPLKKTNDLTLFDIPEILIQNIPITKRSRITNIQKLPNLSQSSFPNMKDVYDLIVIGSGPAGETAATHAMSFGIQNTAIIEKKSSFGGPTGLTSKAIREACKRITKSIDQIGGDRRKQVKALWKRNFPILKTEAEVLQAAESRDKLKANNIDLFIGTAEILGNCSHNSSYSIVRVVRPNQCVDLKAKHLIIATGSRPNRPSHINKSPISFIKNRIVCASEMGNLNVLPNAIAIIGGGVIAVEYATVLAELGVGVSLICNEDSFMPFLENELRESLRKRMKKGHILFVHEPIQSIDASEDDNIKVVLEPRVQKNSTRILPQRKLKIDLVLYSGGRDANSEDLGLEKVGIKTSKYGRIQVDQSFAASKTKSIYAIGDVIGPPGLASTAQYQGRYVAEKLFKKPNQKFNRAANINDDFDEADVIELSDDFDIIQQSDSEEDKLFGSCYTDTPLTLWTIPEIASVGRFGYDIDCKDDLNQKDIVSGYAYFKNCARGRLSGDLDGYLKIVAKYEYKTQQHRIVGCHIFGEGANELIQLGSVLIHTKASLEIVSRTPFAAVTLSGLFQVACDDALRNSLHN